MIRWGVALLILGIAWPVAPPWAFWFGTALCAIGGAMLARGIGNRLRDRDRR